MDLIDIEQKTTIINKFEQVLHRNNGNSIALRYEDNYDEDLKLNKWNKITWLEYYTQSLSFSKALIKLNFELKETVCIYSFNCHQWLISFMGAIMAGGQACGIYPTDSLEQIKYKIDDCNCSVMVVENNSKCHLSLLEDDDLNLKKIIIINCSDKSINHPKVVYIDDFITENNIDDLELEQKLLDIKQQINPDDNACFVYTSGTTGNPKAVCITHDNLIFNAETVLNMTPICKIYSQEERILSYLPLSHVAGMMVDILCPLIGASQGYIINLNFSRSTDLKNGTIKNRLNIVRPTLFLGVPRVWEKFKDAVQKKLEESSNRKQKILNWARKCIINPDLILLKIPVLSILFRKIALLILNKVKKGLGLDQCKYFISGAAPLSKEIIYFFQSLTINIVEVYGMSECTGATSCCANNQIKIGSCGKFLPQTEIKVINNHNPYCIVNNVDEEHPENLQGEICFRGRHVMKGYYCKETTGEKYEQINNKNKETIDHDGWLHSGDKGVVDKNGYVKITGRYKEIIIGAGGENISPVPIENKLKEICPIINQVVMIGDQRKFNVALITLKLTNYGDDIICQTDAIINTDLIDDKCLTTGCCDSKIIDYIIEKINQVNEDGSVTLNNAFKIQKFCILPTNFSIDGGEFTATLKIKRSFIEKKYSQIIEQLYNCSEQCYKCHKIE